MREIPRRSFLMKTKRFFLFGLLAVLLATSLVLTGCGEDDGDGDGGGGGFTWPVEIEGTWTTSGSKTFTFSNTGPTLVESGFGTYTGLSGTVSATSGTFSCTFTSISVTGEYSVANGTMTLKLTTPMGPDTYTLTKSSGDGDGDGSSATAAISGTAKVGETLTATFSGFTADSIYWKSASSATGSSEGNLPDFDDDNTYIIAYPVSVGDYIWVEASNDDHSVEVVSARVGPVAAAN
jgi:hypothetical protein